MKPQFLFILLLSLFIIGVAGLGPAQATTAAAERVLAYAPLPAEQAALPETVTIYAHVNGRSGPALILGADPEALATSGLQAQILESIPARATYYLAYPRPNQKEAELDWTAVDQVLLREAEWRLVRATPEAAESLAAQGIQLQQVTFDPKPLPGATAVLRAPAVVEPDPIIQSMVASVNSSTVYQYDGDLSGEWPVTIGGSPYTLVSRHTNSGTPIQKATQFVGEHFTDLGLAVEYHQWGGATYPNVIGQITGLTDPDTIYILSAHLDDMPSGPLAPGADDNASGVVAAMIAADILSQYQWGCTVRFGLWTGEEQGLNGSAAYAQRAFNSGENIAGVLNLDMIAWNTPNSSRDIDLHASSSLPATLAQAQLFVDVINAYGFDLIPTITPNGSGASDHASFWQYGYPAILGIEDFGDFNPYYHSVSDRLSTLDMSYFTEFVRASLATFVHMTGCLVYDGVGAVDGHVTAQGSGDPIAAANIALQSPAGQTFAAASDASGYYTRTLLADTYTMTVQAYGYLPVTIPDVTIVTNTVTTQDVVLTAASSFTVSGTVVSLDSGLPLAAQIEFVDTPVSVMSNPTTGVYQAALPAGDYTMRVTAVGYQPTERAITLDQNQTQDFYLASRPCVLLVDDDNDSPDVRPYYTAALDALGVSYDVFNAGSGNGPSLDEMTGYQAIIWFSGDKYGTAGPNSADEANLAAYLDAGGRLFLSSQDYLYDMGLTPFGQNYLGIGSFSNDAGNATTKYGVPGDPIGDGLGPYPLSYPTNFTDYGDIVNSGSGASLAFRSSAAGGNGLDVDKASDSWKTLFFGTSWVAVVHANAANGQALLQRILDWFGGCDCQPAIIHDVTTTINACVVDFTPVYGGEAPFTWDWNFPLGNPMTSQSETPSGIDFGHTGAYSYTVTAVNCDGACSDTLVGEVTVQCDVCEPVTAVQLSQTTTTTLYAGDTTGFAVELLPVTAAAPYTYTVSISGTAVITAQTTGSNPFTFDHTFTEPGVYPVLVEVWNCDLASPVSAALTVTILPVTERYKIYLPAVAKE
ncbi:MAG: M20/M25/M40 family metallo-hydrolase [Chloroflexi bacterium]|nr:M20/M25/M40 family metallo-hydrolase [Chloroflexota bacterium]